jgi:hypothetical protein
MANRARIYKGIEVWLMYGKQYIAVVAGCCSLSSFGNQFTYGLPYSAQSTDQGELIVYALKIAAAGSAKRAGPRSRPFASSAALKSARTRRAAAPRLSSEIHERDCGLFGDGLSPGRYLRVAQLEISCPCIVARVEIEPIRAVEYPPS